MCNICIDTHCISASILFICASCIGFVRGVIVCWLSFSDSPRRTHVCHAQWQVPRRERENWMCALCGGHGRKPASMWIYLPTLWPRRLPYARSYVQQFFLNGWFWSKSEVGQRWQAAEKIQSRFSLPKNYIRHDFIFDDLLNDMNDHMGTPHMLSTRTESVRESQKNR